MLGSIRTQKQDFNPRPPRGGRPEMKKIAGMNAAISIHALRGEGD